MLKNLTISPSQFEREVGRGLEGREFPLIIYSKNSLKILEIFMILMTQFTREFERGKEGKNPLRT